MIPNSWWKRAVFYELYVDKFAEDFRGLISKLPYLVNLGVDAVHILPHYPSPMIDDGYDVSDYRNINPSLGSLEDFKAFIENAKKSGVKVMIDLVLNHTSTEHEWFKKAVSHPEGKYRNYYIWSKNNLAFKDAVNAFPMIKESNWIWNENTKSFYFSSFYPEQADLNWENPDVVKEMLGVIDFWIDNGVDAFRLDAAPYLTKKEGTTCKNLPETHEVLKAIRKHIDFKNPNIALLAEVANTPEEAYKYFGDGAECQLVYHFPLSESLATKVVLGENERFEYMSKHLQTPENSAWVAFLRNHDELSLSTLDEITRQKLIAALDKDASLMFGKGVATRLNNMCESSLIGYTAAIQTAHKALFDLKSAVVIYYGDEIGIKNGANDGGKDTRRVVREKFDWLEAEKQIKNEKSLFNTVKKFIYSRKLNFAGKLKQFEIR